MVLCDYRALSSAVRLTPSLLMENHRIWRCSVSFAPLPLKFWETDPIY